MTPGSLQMEDVKPLIPSSNSQSDDSAGIEARFADLCKVFEFFFFFFFDFCFLSCFDL